jgi:hypothetical protein
MHDALISTSSRALATESFSRLSSFPRSEPDSPVIRDARRRAAEAEAALQTQKAKLANLFTELLRRFLARPDVAEEGLSALGHGTLRERRESSGRERIWTEVKSGADEAGKEVEVVSGAPQEGGARSIQLAPAAGPSRSAPIPPLVEQHGLSEASEAESSARGAALPSTEAEAGAVAVEPASEQADGAATPRETKRIKLRELLDDVLSRLEAVEANKVFYEERCNDLEYQLNVLESDELDALRARRPGTWEELEARRDPSGSLRGLERGQPLGEVTASSADGAGAGANETEVVAVANGDQAILAEASGSASASAEVQPPLSVLPIQPVPHVDEVKALRDELAAARTEISQIKEEREVRDQQLVTAILNRVRAEYEEVTRKVSSLHLVASHSSFERRSLQEDRKFRRASP